MILSMGDNLVPSVMDKIKEVTGEYPAPTNSQTLLCDGRCLVGALITGIALHAYYKQSTRNAVRHISIFVV